MIEIKKLSTLKTWSFKENFPEPFKPPIGVEVYKISEENYFVVNKRDIHFLNKLRDLPPHIKKKILKC
jgi:hypothetical protein